MKKTSRKEKRKQANEQYSGWDFLADLLFFWLPDLIVLPFRLLFMGIRMLIRAIFDSV